MDDRRKKGEFVGALGALLVHVAVIALLILVSFTVPQPDEDAGGVPVMLGNVEFARGFDDPSLVDVDILPEEPEAPAPAETQPELPEKPAEEAPEKADAEPVAETGAQYVSADSNDTEEKKVQEPVNENPQESPVQE